MPRPPKERTHLYEKRKELVWALELQGYSGVENGVIFNVHESVISRINKKRPKRWKPKWIKAVK